MSSLPTDPQSPQTPTNKKSSSSSSLPGAPHNSQSSSYSENNGTFTISNKNSNNGILDCPDGDTFTIELFDGIDVKPGHYRSVSGAFSVSTLDDINLLTSSDSVSGNSTSITPEEPLLRTSDLSEHNDDSGESESTITSPSATMLHTDNDK